MAGLGRTIPALPVRDITRAVGHFRDRLGFTPLHVDDGFAVLQRDDARIHLWHAADRTWSGRADLRERPVYSGAESSLAGTASCRIETETLMASTLSSPRPTSCIRSRATASPKPISAHASSPASTPTAT